MLFDSLNSILLQQNIPYISKRTFYPGNSFFFWLLIAMGFYLYYLYSTSKNKKDFVKSPFYQSLSVALILFLVSFISINVFFSDPKENKEITVEKKITVDELLTQDQRMMEKVEAHFVDPDIHYKFIQHHFEIPDHWKDKYGQYTERDDYTIVNYYQDKLSTGDSNYVYNSRIALGMIYFKKGNLNKSLSYFNSFLKSFPFVEYYKAEIYYQSGEVDSAIAHFRKATFSNDIFKDSSAFALVSILEGTGKESELYTLLKNDSYKKYFSNGLASRIYFLNNDIIGYAGIILPRAFSGFKMTGFIAASVIMLVWIFYIVGLDIFERESSIIMILVLLAGMFFTLTCFYFYDFLHYRLHFNKQEDNLFLYCFLGIGVVEEFVKIIPLILLLLVAPRIVNEPYDYILYAAISALGFSFMENLIYFGGDLDLVIHGRGLTSVPGHIIDSSIVAYGFVLARYRYKSYLRYLFPILFFFLGALSHGLYDYWLYANLYPFFILGFIISVSLWIIIINNCLNNSPSFDYLISARSDTIQLTLSLSLLGILVLEYIMVAWERGPTFANESFNSYLIVGGVFITYYSKRLFSVDLVKGYWSGIPFKTIGEQRAGALFDFKNFIIRFISGNTFSQSFVEMEVGLHPDPSNERLSVYFVKPVKGIISDRLVVKCKNKKGTLYSDPYWFRIDTVQPIDVGGAVEELFLFRFDEDQPSFENEDQIMIYLFVLKDKDVSEDNIFRDDLRALGKAWIKKLRK